MGTLEEEIQRVNDKITQEIRLNRALKAEIDNVFREHSTGSSFMMQAPDNFERNCNFIEELEKKYEVLKYKIEKGRHVEIGELSALLKSFEIEEKYLLDKYYKSKAHCTISYFASDMISRSLQATATSSSSHTCEIFIVLIFSIVLVCILFFFNP